MYKQRRNSSLASKAFRLTAGDIAANRIEDDEILTVRQVSKLLKLHPRTIYKLARDSGTAIRQKLAVFEVGDN